MNVPSTPCAMTCKLKKYIISKKKESTKEPSSIQRSSEISKSLHACNSIEKLSKVNSYKKLHTRPVESLIEISYMFSDIFKIIIRNKRIVKAFTLFYFIF